MVSELIRGDAQRVLHLGVPTPGNGGELHVFIRTWNFSAGARYQGTEKATSPAANEGTHSVQLGVETVCIWEDPATIALW